MLDERRAPPVATARRAVTQANSPWNSASRRRSTSASSKSQNRRGAATSAVAGCIQLVKEPLAAAPARCSRGLVRRSVRERTHLAPTGATAALDVAPPCELSTATSRFGARDVDTNARMTRVVAMTRVGVSVSMASEITPSRASRHLQAARRLPERRRRSPSARRHAPPCVMPPRAVRRHPRRDRDRATAYRTRRPCGTRRRATGLVAVRARRRAVGLGQRVAQMLAVRRR